MQLLRSVYRPLRLLSATTTTIPPFVESAAAARIASSLSSSLSSSSSSSSFFSRATTSALQSARSLLPLPPPRRSLGGGPSPAQFAPDGTPPVGVDVEWQPESTAQFLGKDASGNAVLMSGSDEPGIGPMKLLLLGVGGCAAVDLVSILKKQRQAVASVRIRVEGQRARDMPRPFVAVHTTFVVTGKGLDRAKVERAVELSLEKYCGVHGTLAAGVKHLTWGAETRELE